MSKINFMVLTILWHFWNKWSLGCFLIVIFYTEVTKTLKHELFLSFLAIQVIIIHPFSIKLMITIYYIDLTKIKFRNSVWRMLPGYAYLWHLSTWDMNDGLLVMVRVLKQYPHIPDHHYDKLRCKFSTTKN